MRLAISNPDMLGDFVVRQPMLAALAAAGHEMLLIVRAHTAPLAAWAVPNATIVQCVADPYLPGYQLDAAPDDRLVNAVTAFDPDIFVVASYQHTQLEEQLAQRLPRAKVIGFNGELFQNDKARKITHLPAINWTVQVQVGRDWLESRKNELLAGAILGTSVTLPAPRLTPTKAFLTAAARRLRQHGFEKRKFWIVCAGEGSAYTRLKNWSLEKWAAVCSAAVRDHGLLLVFVGTPAEHESIATIRAAMGELAAKTIDMTATPDGLDMLVGLTALADGYLGKDSGPMHIAAALGKPVVAVFGGGHWPRFLPSSAVGRVLSVNVPCSDCNWICPYKTSYCVKNIPTEEVLQAVAEVAAGTRKEFEVSLLQPEPWVARAMMLDAAEIGRDAMGVLEVERANFVQWHDDRVRDIEGLQQKISALDAEKNSLSTGNSLIAAELSTFRDGAIDALAARKELEQTLAIRDQEIAHLNQQTAAIDAAHQAEAATLRLLLSQKDEELGLLNERAATAVAQTEIARGQTDASRKECEEAVAALASQTAQLSELQTLLAAQQAEAATLRESNRRLDLECAERVAVLASQTAQLSELQTLLAAQQAEAATLRLLLSQKDEELGRLNERAATAAAQTEIARSQTDASRTQYEEAFAALASRTAQLSEHQTLFVASQAEVTTLRESNRRLDLECAERAAALDAALASCDQIESRYQGTIADLRRQLRRAQDQLTSVLTLVANLRDELARSLAEIARIPGFKQDLAAKQTHIDELTATLNAVEADRADRLDIIHTLTAQLAVVETDRANRGIQIDLLHEHIAHQQVKIERIEASLLPRRLMKLLGSS
jgi:ADP-heptose:LPS heptosyltransferase